MIYIIYFSLLLFCISTNMIRCMGLTQNSFNPQTQTEAYDPWGWNSTNSNETRDSSILSPRKATPLQGLDLLQAQKITDDLWKCFTLPKKPSNSSDIFTNRTFTTNRSSNSQQQPDAKNLSISSPSRRRYSLSTASENTNNFMDLTQQTLDFDYSQQPSTESLKTIPQKILSLRPLEIDT